MSYKKSSIIKEAGEIKKFIETNRKIPASCKLDNNIILSPYSISYLLAVTIQEYSKQDYNLKPVVKYNTSKYIDTIINQQVTKKDYLAMINNFVKYCNNTRRVPAFITIPSTSLKVSFEVFMYCLSKILVYYADNKSLPNYCIMDKNFIPASPSPQPSGCYKKYNNKSGCEAMGQNNNYYCGVSALQKVLYKFGIQETQKQLAKWAGTTTAGTSHNGIRTTIAKVNQKHKVKLTVKEANFSDYSLKELKQILCSKNKDIIWHLLYKLNYGHYEKCLDINLDNKTFEVINSLGSKCNYGCFCGHIEHRSYDLQKRYINGISQPSLIIISMEA